MAAGRAWAAGRLGGVDVSPDDAEALADARRWGAGDDALDALRATLDAPHPSDWRGAWPDNCAGIDAFLSVQTQWRVGGGLKPMFVGLDYGGARAAHDALGMSVTPTAWDAMQVVEAGALAALNGSAT